VGVSSIVVVVAIVGYGVTGSPSLATRGEPPPAAAADNGEREASLKQIAAMVDKLASRLQQRPDDAEGWKMLARSYSVLGRYGDALPAYRRAVALNPKDAGLLADQADAVAAANGGQQNAESVALIDRALALDPSQPKALALSGTIAFERGDFATAVSQWQKIADALPPDSDFHRQVMENIDEARRRGGLPAAAKRSPVSSSSDRRSRHRPRPTTRCSCSRVRSKDACRWPCCARRSRTCR
jgi:cytochrome c-type biogenesis protein CcmH